MVAVGIRNFANIQFRSDFVFGTFFFIHPVESIEPKELIVPTEPIVPIEPIQLIVLEEPIEPIVPEEPYNTYST